VWTIGLQEQFDHVFLLYTSAAIKALSVAAPAKLGNAHR
jgi:hypothetical protein